MPIHIKRAYEKASEHDGIRILVDRLWPRGITKEEIKIDYWMKQLAPSNELRKGFHHESIQFEAFKEKYLAELRNDEEKIELLKELKKIVNENENVTLIYAANDKENNQAQILKELLDLNHV